MKILVAKILVGLTLLLLSTCTAAGKLKEPRVSWEPYNTVFLRTHETLRTLGMNMPTYKYKFQDQYFHTLKGSNVYVFGLKTDREARITLHDSSGKQPDIRFTLNQEVAHEEDEWECSVTYMDRNDPSTFYIPCYLDLHRDTTLWFTVLTKKGYIAIYENGIDTPVVDLSKKDLGIKDINFNKYDSYTVATEDTGVWDFQGHTLKNEDLYEPYLDKHLRKALRKTRKNYLVAKRHQWRCYHAGARKNKEKDKALKFKYAKFVQRNCYMRTFQPYLDTGNRQAAILKIHGKKIPGSEVFDVLKWFKEDYSP